MNWGIRIIILYSGFVILILSLVFLSAQQKFDLVAPDYYSQELKFQEKIDQRNAADALTDPLTWEVKKGEIAISFPQLNTESKPTGKILFFRPSGSEYDKSFEIKTDSSNTQIIHTNELTGGYYQLKIEWNQNGVDYFKEGDVSIVK